MSGAAGVLGAKASVDPANLLEKRVAALAYLSRAVSPEGVFLWNAVHVDPSLVVKFASPGSLAKLYASLAGRAAWACVGAVRTRCGRGLLRRSNHFTMLGVGLGKLLGLAGGITTLRGLAQLLLEFEAWEGMQSGVVVGAGSEGAPASTGGDGGPGGPKHSSPQPPAAPSASGSASGPSSVAGPRSVPRTVSGPASRKPRVGSRALGGGGGGGAGGSVSGADLPGSVAGSLAQGLGVLFSRAREMGPYPDSISGVDLNAPVRPAHFRHRGRAVFEFLPNDPLVPFDMLDGEGNFPLVATAFCEVAGQVYRKLADGTVAWSGPQADVSPALVQALRKADRGLKHYGIKPLALLLTNVARRVATERLALLSGSLFAPALAPAAPASTHFLHTHPAASSTAASSSYGASASSASHDPTAPAAAAAPTAAAADAAHSDRGHELLADAAGDVSSDEEDDDLHDD
jgi:hypothetical protein